MNIFIPFSVLF